MNKTIRKKEPLLSFYTQFGKEFKIYLKKLRAKEEGFCENPLRKKPKIVIDERLLPRRELAVICEEIAHAFFYEKTEREIRRFAAVLTKTIYKRGYRKILNSE